MPRYKKSTQRLKAKKIAKDCIDAGLNQSLLAKRRGVSHQAANQLVNRKPVKDALEAYFNNQKSAKKVAKCIDAGLGATKPTWSGSGLYKRSKKKREVDHHCRHKFVNTFLQATGKIKLNGNGKEGPRMVQIFYGYRQAKVEEASRELSGK